VAVDRTVVGSVAAELMDELDEKFGDGEDANIRAVFLIVAVDYEGDDGQEAEVRWGVSDNLQYYEGIGLLEHVIANL
jgi:hypothetical protein